MRYRLLAPVCEVLAGCAALTIVAACSSGGAPDASRAPALAPTSVGSSSTPPTAGSAASTPAASASASSSSSPVTSARPTSSARPAPGASRTVPRGTIVVLNPGHNGGNASHTGYINRQVPAGYGERKACDTTGTTTNAGYSEHAFNWDVAVRVRRFLQASGVTVVMTRPNDDGVGPCVDERADVGNRADVAACVSIHADGAGESGHGFHVNQDSRRPDGASKRTAQQSIELGKAIHKTLESSSGLVPSTYIGENGYYYRSDLAGLNLATKPTTFLELGNMRNAGDAALLSSKVGRARIAGAVAAGIIAFLRAR